MTACTARPLPSKTGCVVGGVAITKIYHPVMLQSSRVLYLLVSTICWLHLGLKCSKTWSNGWSNHILYLLQKIWDIRDFYKNWTINFRKRKKINASKSYKCTKTVKWCLSNIYQYHSRKVNANGYDTPNCIKLVSKNG